MLHEGHGPHIGLLRLAQTALQAAGVALYQMGAEGAGHLQAAIGTGAPKTLPSAVLEVLEASDGIWLEDGFPHLPGVSLEKSGWKDKAVACTLVYQGAELVGVVLAWRGEPFSSSHRETLEQVAVVAAGFFERDDVEALAELERERSLYLMNQHPAASEEQYQAFVTQSSEGIWCYVFDPPIATELPVEEQIQQASETGRLTLCNDAMARMYGFERAEEMKATLPFRRIPLGEAGNLENIHTFFQGGYRATNLETLEYDRHGQPHYFSNNVVGIVEAGFLVRIWGSQVDITARKRAEQAFLESEERWHRLVDRHPQPILITRKGIIDYMNQAGLDLLGLATQGEAQGRRLHDFIVPEMHDLLEERIGAVAQDQIEAPLRYKVLTARSEVRYIEAFSLPVVYEGENVAQSTWRDVTERVRAEEALRESEYLLSSINQSISEGIYRSTPRGEILYVNEAIVRMFGYSSAEEMMATATPGTLYKDLAQRVELMALLRENHGFQNEEVKFLRKDGSSFWGLMSANVMLNENGGIRFYNGVITDITERKAAAQALEVSEERWRTLVESHPEPIMISQDDHILYLNDATVQMLRAPSAEVVYQRRVSDFVAPEFAEVRKKWMATLSRGETVKPVEFRIFDLEGEERYVETVAVPTTYAGRLATQVVMRDTTERHRYEQALIEAREKAVEMARLKSAFLANMSHEIRTPLTAIIGFADVLAEEVRDENREFAQLIRQSGQRLMETLNSVLDLAQIESGSLELAPARVDVGEIVWQVLHLFTVQARQQGLDLHLEAPDAPVYAWLDAGALSRSLTNLVANAIKFTAAGYVRVVVHTDESGLELRVEDTGVGISEGFMAKVFSEFYQESSGMTRGYEGSGLGLSITHHLVDLMGGTIRVESEKGEGSVFILQFPVSVLHEPDELQAHAQAD